MINIYHHYRLYFVISALMLIPGMVSLALFGLKPSIDFVGGSLLEIRLSDASLPSSDELQTLFAEDMPVVSVQSSGPNQVIIKSGFAENAQKDAAVQKLQDSLGVSVQELRFETIGPTLSRELLTKTLTAIALVSLIITGYIWYRFHEWSFGMSAILAMFHDALIVIGTFSLLGYFFGVEVDVLFVTAVLTTLSFSVHDTVVLFDRIRELRPKFAGKPFIELANMASIQTFTRSFNNSVTIILMLLALFLLGGQSIRWFSFALLIGAIVGTYSSPFTSVPILIEWERWKKKRKK